MIHIYWPRKSIPSWLQKISFSGTSKGVPRCYHNGFGLVLKRNNQYHVHQLAGAFIYINAAGMSVTLEGGGDGVFINSK